MVYIMSSSIQVQPISTIPIWGEPILSLLALFFDSITLYHLFLMLNLTVHSYDKKSIYPWIRT